MKSRSVNRREFIGAGLAVSGALYMPTISVAQDPQPPTRMRYSAFSANGKAMLTLYEKGVRQMKSWSDTDASNPRGWIFQAAIHGSPVLTNPPANQCAHASWWFLPWHRAYLYYFENIVRAACGEDSFTLPYWPWDDDRYLNLPPEFLQTGSALFDNTRNTDVNKGKPIPSRASFVTAALGMTKFLSTRTELGFGGAEHPTRIKAAMERPPHDSVHGLVGGAGNMASPGTAALDPIFWLHHANVDRLWDEWLSRGNTNPDDEGWRTQLTIDEAANPITGWFYDGNGRDQKGIRTSDVIPGGKLYNYMYESVDPIRIALLSHPEMLSSVKNLAATQSMAKDSTKANELRQKLFAAGPTTRLVEPNNVRVTLGTSPVKLSVTVPADRLDSFKTLMELHDVAVTKQPAMILTIADVQTAAPPGVVYGVYIAEVGGGELVNTASSSVGEITFFISKRHGHDDNAAGETFTFNITQQVKNLQAQKKAMDGNLQVFIIPKGVGGDVTPKANVTIGSVFVDAVTD